MMNRMAEFDRSAFDTRTRCSRWGACNEEIPVARNNDDSVGDIHHSAIEVLNLRYAKGEIQKPEYDDIKQTILSGGQS